MEPGRQIRRAAIALGANLGDRRATLERAVALIGAEIGPVEARSGWLETAAMIHPDDPAQSYPAFINGVLLASTSLAPLEVLDRLHGIEARLGRDRNAETARWRPRLIDLDLIAVEDSGSRHATAAASASGDAQTALRAGAYGGGLAGLVASVAGRQCRRPARCPAA